MCFAELAAACFESRISYQDGHSSYTLFTPILICLNVAIEGWAVRPIDEEDAMATRMFLTIITIILMTVPASAQNYPNKVITVVVPFTAGGPTDTVARLISAPMSKSLNTQVIV